MKLFIWKTVHHQISLCFQISPTNQKKKNLLSSYINKELSQTPLLRPPPPPPSPSAAAARFLPSPTVSPRRRSLPLLRHPSLPPDRPSLSATETAPGSVPIRVVAASDGFFFLPAKSVAFVWSRVGENGSILFVLIGWIDRSIDLGGIRSEWGFWVRKWSERLDFFFCRCVARFV